MASRPVKAAVVYLMLAGDVDRVELEVVRQKEVYARPWLLGSKRKRRMGWKL